MDVSHVRIERIFHPGAPAASPADSLREAAAAMRTHGVSCHVKVFEGELTVTGERKADMEIKEERY